MRYLLSLAKRRCVYMLRNIHLFQTRSVKQNTLVTIKNVPIFLNFILKRKKRACKKDIKENKLVWKRTSLQNLVSKNWEHFLWPGYKFEINK